MKVLLLKKINKLGDIGSSISVKPGYARNYLLPKKIAVLPTEENMLLVEAKKKELLVEEVSSTVSYLMGEESSGITGQIIHVDNGTI